MPFYEQSAAHSKYNFNACSSMSSPYGQPLVGDDTVNLAITSVRMKVLECASAPARGQEFSSTPGTTQFYSMRAARRANYLFATGVFTDYDADWQDKSIDLRQGMFGNNGAADFAELTDGSSNTIAIGEAVGGIFKVSAVFGPWGLNGTHTCCHGRVVSTIANGRLAPTAAERRDWNINSAWQGRADGKSYAWVFNSAHPGGAQFAMGDGSVQFLQEGIDYLTFCRLNYIHDGEVVSLDN
jgi:prepilin-type processing-associated H-X9-DG protein